MSTLIAGQSRKCALADFAVFEIQNSWMALLGALLFEQIAKRAQVEIEIGRLETEVVG